MYSDLSISVILFIDNVKTYVSIVCIFILLVNVPVKVKHCEGSRIDILTLPLSYIHPMCVAIGDFVLPSRLC